MSSTLPQIMLKNGKERSILFKHPWIFSGAVAKEDKHLKEGDIVRVISSNNEFLAIGHFHKGTILVRCISFEDVAINQDFWDKKIESAYAFRKTIGLTDSKTTNTFRLIHGEGDGCPGLVIDVYNNTAIIQTYTTGMHLAKQFIKDALINILGDKLSAIYDKSAETMSKQGGVESEDAYLWKANSDDEICVAAENGYQFAIDWVNGQKTGFFIDQRENRELVKRYSKDKNVLNTFCYTGGFSVYALGGGAKRVVSVDSSKRAIEGTEKNIALNFTNVDHVSYVQDVMSYLKAEEEKFDLIILDPPAYAKHLSQVKQAMVGYRNLNSEGLKKIKSGGLLFTFSCSQAVDAVLFRKLIFQAAVQAKRNVRILHQLSQPPDHPINIYHPEGEYLTGLVLYVE
jgi:23S rRNA (cytosine1962-C5)-methyltransferase